MGRFRTAIILLTAAVVLLGVTAGPAQATRLLRVSASMSTHYPAQYSYVTPKVKARDQYGKPISGVKCVFTWHYKTTTPVVTKYTGSTGVASCSRNIGRATKGYKVAISIRCTWKGQVKTCSTWFTPH